MQYTFLKYSIIISLLWWCNTYNRLCFILWQKSMHINFTIITFICLNILISTMHVVCVLSEFTDMHCFHFSFQIVPLTFPGAHSSSHRCTTFCYGFQVERHVSWKRCATGFEIRFLLFGWCVKNISPISSNMYINHAVLKRQLAQWSK